MKARYRVGWGWRVKVVGQVGMRHVECGGMGWGEAVRYVGMLEEAAGMSWSDLARGG